MICKHIILIMFLNKPKLILMQTTKWFQILLCFTNTSIKHESFVFTQLNDLTVLFLTIPFSISCLLALSSNVKKFYLAH